MTIKLLLRQPQNISQVDAGKIWRITDLPAYVELCAVSSCKIPAGWVLIRGELRLHGQDFTTKLIAKFESDEKPDLAFALPANRHGAIHELIFFPAGVTRLLLEPMQSLGDFELGEIFLKPVGQVERIVRMWRRIIPVFHKKSRLSRHKAGLRVYTPFIDLQKAYRIASRFRAYAPSPSYDKWIARFDSIKKTDRNLIQQDIQGWHAHPHFEIILVLGGSGLPGFELTLKSLRTQLYRRFHLQLLVSPKERTEIDPLALPEWVEVIEFSSDTDLVKMVNARLKENKPRSWGVVLQAGSVLAEHALYLIADEAVKTKNACFVYSDHDQRDEAGRRIGPVFKPDWSPELLRSTNYIGASAAVRADVLEQAGGLSISDVRDHDYHDLYLRITEQIKPGTIRHVPFVLWHLPAGERLKRDLGDREDTNPVAAHLRRLGVPASVEKLSTGRIRVKYALPKELPKVSIVVPTRDGLDYLRPCVESVLNTSSYPNFELIVVDNQSADPETLIYLDALTQRPNVRVLRYDRPFNYSAINNFAVRAASGNIICLLNNDTEVITPDWLEEMLGRLLQPQVGVVGAKLLYADGRVQHGGDTVGPGGCANHLHSFIDRDAPGYCDRAILAQDLSAVTAACLLTWRELFTELGGLDARNLPVAFNDVDYCLRVGEAGYRVIWTPFAELYHHESVSRGKDKKMPQQIQRSRREAAYMRKRWGHEMKHDPFYNLNLSYERADFSLSHAPMVNKPWRKSSLLGL